MVVYNTPMNTLGIGDPVPFGANGSYGSGDLFNAIMPIATKKPNNKNNKKQNKNILSVTAPRPLIVMKKK